MVAPLVSQSRRLVQCGAAGIGHPQNPGYLVKALPCGIIQSSPQNLHFRIILHIHNHGVSAGNHQTKKGRLQLGVGQIIGGNVSPDVVDRNQRLVQRQSGSLGKVHAHQDRTNQPRRIGHRYCVNILSG